jgi:hypothetical protein
VEVEEEVTGTKVDNEEDVVEAAIHTLVPITWSNGTNYPLKIRKE